MYLCVCVVVVDWVVVGKWEIYPLCNFELEGQKQPAAVVVIIIIIIAGVWAPPPWSQCFWDDRSCKSLMASGFLLIPCFWVCHDRRIAVASGVLPMCWMLESLCGFGFRIGTSLVYSFPQQAGRQDGVFSPNLELSSGSGTAHLLNPRWILHAIQAWIICLWWQNSFQHFFSSANPFLGSSMHPLLLWGMCDRIFVACQQEVHFIMKSFTSYSIRA